jgi:hypothetical protein
MNLTLVVPEYILVQGFSPPTKLRIPEEFRLKAGGTILSTRLPFTCP